MTTDLIARLEAAQSEGGEREALRDALDCVWPASNDHPVSRAQSDAYRIISCPRAGWIGIPLLMVPTGWWWDVGTSMHGDTFIARIGEADQTFESDAYDDRCIAKIASCALCIAALRARQEMRDG